MKKNKSKLQLWGIPFLIAVVSLCGLIMALVDDGFWDVFSWVTLSVPLIIIVRYNYFAKR